MLDFTCLSFSVQFQLVLQQVGLICKEETCSFDRIGVDVGLVIPIHVIVFVNGIA